MHIAIGAIPVNISSSPSLLSAGTSFPGDDDVVSCVIASFDMEVVGSSVPVAADWVTADSAVFFFGMGASWSRMTTST